MVVDLGENLARQGREEDEKQKEPVATESPRCRLHEVCVFAEPVMRGSCGIKNTSVDDFEPGRKGRKVSIDLGNPGHVPQSKPPSGISIKRPPMNLKIARFTVLVHCQDCHV